MKSKIAAALLAFFLGGLGAHKFYLGKPGMGILYLIFCWTFVPAIIALIEGIIFLTTSDADFNGKYNKKYFSQNQRQPSYRDNSGSSLQNNRPPYRSNNISDYRKTAEQENANAQNRLAIHNNRNNVVEKLKALIKCKSCGAVYSVENETELRQKNISYNCKCGKKMEVAFFGSCCNCNKYVGFRTFGMTEHAADLGRRVIKGVVKGAVMGYFGLDPNKSIHVDNGPADDICGFCPLCDHKHVHCKHCGKVFEVSVLLTSITICPQCNSIV